MVKMSLKARARLAVLEFGKRTSERRLANLRSLHSYLELGHWLAHDMSGHTPEVVSDDISVFSRALENITGERPLYLEFGVFEGRSMRWWSEHLRNPGAKLIGFDSFAGLPADWRPGLEAGTFATFGPPKIDDHRVSFEVGWFDETLPGFSMPEHDQLIVNVDSDIYSSAVTVLKWVKPYLKEGTLIYFDEFPDRDHEMRAFREFLESSDIIVRPLAFAQGGVHWLFEVTRHARPEQEFSVSEAAIR